MKTLVSSIISLFKKKQHWIPVHPGRVKTLWKDHQSTRRIEDNGQDRQESYQDRDHSTHIIMEETLDIEEGKYQRPTNKQFIKTKCYSSQKVCSNMRESNLHQTGIPLVLYFQIPAPCKSVPKQWRTWFATTDSWLCNKNKSSWRRGTDCREGSSSTCTETFAEREHHHHSTTRDHQQFHYYDNYNSSPLHWGSNAKKWCIVGQSWVWPMFKIMRGRYSYFTLNKFFY